MAVSEARANLCELNILVRQNRALIRQDPSYEVRSQVWSVPHTGQCLSGAAWLQGLAGGRPSGEAGGQDPG